MLYPTNLISTVGQYREKEPGWERDGKGVQPKVVQTLMDRPKGGRINGKTRNGASEIIRGLGHVAVPG